MNIAKVTVEIALDREFDYLIPEELSASVRLGSRVLVPFGRTHARGYVVGFADHSEFKNLKSISSLVGAKPLINENMLALARWISDYYASAFEQAIRSLLPCAVRRAKAGFRSQNSVSPVPEAVLLRSGERDPLGGICASLRGALLQAEGMLFDAAACPEGTDALAERLRARLGGK